MSDSTWYKDRMKAILWKVSDSDKETYGDRGDWALSLTSLHGLPQFLHFDTEEDAEGFLENLGFRKTRPEGGFVD